MAFVNTLRGKGTKNPALYRRTAARKPIPEIKRKPSSICSYILVDRVYLDIYYVHVYIIWYADTLYVDIGSIRFII